MIHFEGLGDGALSAGRHVQHWRMRKAAGGSSVQAGIRQGVVAAVQPGDESLLRNAALLLICYNRPDYLRRTLDSLFALEGVNRWPVYVSQDGSHAETAAVARTFNVTLWQRDRHPLLSPNQQGQAYLAQHYKWALDRVLHERGHSHAVLLEDDMLFSPDFLSYFEQTAWLLAADPTIWCVSSWNDNGFDDLVAQEDAPYLFRTDYFPGLGWMLRRELWDELSPRFPLEHWDHWMRLNSTSKGRDCLVPRVSRNYNIGVKGANMQSAQYDRYLKRVRYSKERRVRLHGLDDLVSARYEAQMEGLVRRAAQQQLALTQSPGSLPPSQDAPYLYTYTADSFPKLAGLFRIWPVPRGAHRHTSVLRHRGNTFVLASSRFSPYLPPQLRELPPAGMALRAGERGQSCDAVCGAVQARCQQSAFEFANQVKALRAAFPCENGFATVVGPDIPNYVPVASNEYSRRCLVSEGGSLCTASHKDTRRLCPCIPSAADTQGREAEREERVPREQGQVRRRMRAARRGGDDQARARAGERFFLDSGSQMAATRGNTAGGLA